VGLFRKRRRAIEPLNVEAFDERVEEAEQDNSPAPDDMNLEKIESEETRNSHHGGFPNFGR
jgi:hypothetical protein